MERLSNSHFLYPSKIFVSKEPVDIITVLGSCVSVCLWDIKEKIGGMNHFMLPLWNGKELASPKYGNIAIERLIAKMLELGSLKSNLVAKIFGGSETLQANKSFFLIGKRNIEIAFNLLRQENIHVINQSIGTNQSRRILFRTSTGEVFLKFIKRRELIFS